MADLTYVNVENLHSFVSACANTVLPSSISLSNLNVAILAAVHVMIGLDAAMFCVVLAVLDGLTISQPSVGCGSEPSFCPRVLTHIRIAHNASVIRGGKIQRHKNFASMEANLT